MTAEEEAELARVTDYRWGRAVLLGNKPFETLPIALGFCRLRSGRLALFQSRPVRTDHIGRPGSHIAHAFVFHEELQVQLGSPTRYWQSPSFRPPLTDAEVQATIRPRPLELLPPNQIEPNPDDIEQRFVTFLRERGAKKLAELLGLGTGDPAARRGPIVVAGPSEHVLLAVLAHEHYRRRRPVFYLTYISDSDFNSATNDHLLYEVCGEFGSHELARSWRDARRAWLFEWDTAPPADIEAPEYLEGFIAAGGFLEHHDYLGPDEGHEVIPQIDGWLKWAEKVPTLSRAAAEQLTRYAATSSKSKLRALAMEQVATTLAASLAVVPDRALVALLARAARDDFASPLNDPTVDCVVATIEGLCTERNTTPDALGEALNALRGMRLGCAVGSAFTHRLLASHKRDEADSFVAARLAALVVGLAAFDRNGDEQQDFSQLLRNLIMQSGTVCVLFDLSYAAADNRILPALRRACQQHPTTFQALADQLANWCERCFDAGERPAVVCRWLLTSEDQRLVSHALTGVLANVRLDPAELRVVLDIARTSGLDERGQLSRDLIRACGTAEQNTLPLHLKVVLESARAIDLLDVRLAALRLAEEQSSGIALMSADSRALLLRQVQESLERLGWPVGAPRLRALLWINWVADNPRHISVNAALAHVAAIKLFDDTARKHLLTELVGAALCVQPYGERPIYVALKCLREFRRDPAAEGLLSRILDVQSDTKAQLDTLVARVHLRTSSQIVLFVDDDVLGTWLERNQTLRRALDKHLRQLGPGNYDEAFIREIEARLQEADGRARGWR